ncbi:MAG: NADH-ubiquinone oxidoreductase-F iron-sulfur binding region domain-containing protein, partial [bacterium]
QIDNAPTDSAEAGNILVVGNNSCMVRLARDCAKFYVDESCGYCTPGREGLTQLKNILSLLVQGKNAQINVGEMKQLCATINGNCYCSHGNRGGVFIHKILTGWPDDFARHLNSGECEICND